MAYSQDDIAREVIAELFALASGQPANPEDAARVVARLPAVVAELQAMNIIYIADAEYVPDSAVNAFVAYAAQTLAPNFGLPTDEAKKSLAESKLRTLQRIGRGTGQMLRVDRALAPRRYLGLRVL